MRRELEEIRKNKNLPELARPPAGYRGTSRDDCNRWAYLRMIMHALSAAIRRHVRKRISGGCWRGSVFTHD
jgi:hypothetical protein